LHTQRPQSRGQNPYLYAKLLPAQRLERPGLARMQQRDASRALARKYVLGVIETSTGEPFGPGHGAPAEHPRVWGGGLHPEIIPQRAPERLEVFHRPEPQVHVIA